MFLIIFFKFNLYLWLTYRTIYFQQMHLVYKWPFLGHQGTFISSFILRKCRFISKWQLLGTFKKPPKWWEGGKNNIVSIQCCQLVELTRYLYIVLTWSQKLNYINKTFPGCTMNHQSIIWSQRQRGINTTLIDCKPNKNIHIKLIPRDKFIQ